MALHLIIDGYNLIRQSPRLQELDAQGLEAGREALLAILTNYRRARWPHKTTVVFDGWQGGALKESRERFQGMAIVFSRRGEKADEVIKRLLALERERAVVVTSDREIQDCAQRVGAAWVTAPEFERRLNLAGELPELADEPSPRRTQKKGAAHRLPKQQRRRQQRLKKL